MSRSAWTSVVAADRSMLLRFHAALERGYQSLIANLYANQAERVRRALAGEDICENARILLVVNGNRVGACAKVSFGHRLPVEEELGVDLLLLRSEFGQVG